MTGAVREHATSTSVVMAVPAEVEAGADLALQISLSCTSACDLRGSLVRIVNDKDESVAATVKVTEFDGTTNRTDQFGIKAPAKPGKYTWTALFPAQEDRWALHEASTAQFSFVVKPHTTFVQVVNVPDPVTCGEQFKITVGAKCSAGCQLAGAPIEINDYDGTLLARASLGEGTSPNAGLYSTEIALKAPHEEGRYMWTAKLLMADPDSVHAPSSRAFTFGVARKGEHVLTIEIIDGDTKSPIKHAPVVIRPVLYNGYAYSGDSDDAGVARLSLPKGEYQVYVSGNGKELFLPIVKVAGDLTIQAEVQVKQDELMA